MSNGNTSTNNSSSQYEYAETSGTELYASKNPALKLNKALYEKYLDKVFEIRPNIKQIYDENIDVDLVSYDKKHVRDNRNPIIKTRKAEIIDVIQAKTKKVLGTKIADSVAKQLKGNSSVSTTQHTAPLGHYVLKLALQNSLAYFDNDNPNLQNVIILACAGVSFNNSSTPRSLLLHTEKDLDYLPFFGRSADASPVIYHPAYGYESIENMEKELNKIRQQKGLSKLQYDKVKEILEDVYASPHALTQDYFTDQITVINHNVFKKVFEKYHGYVPNLVFLSQEEIVIEAILKNHLYSKTTINSVLINTKMHVLLEKYFDNTDGAFNLKKQKGTFLFWGYDKKTKNRLQLFRKGKYLVSLDNQFKVKLTPDDLSIALREKILIPSVMLTFFVLAFYYGLFLTGAYKQSNDLPKLLEKYKKVMKLFGDKTAIEATEGLITTNLIVPASLLYLKQSEKYVPATALDIMSNPDSQGNWNEIITAFKNLPFSSVIIKMFPIIYNRLCPANQKEEDLASITEQDLDQFTDFPKKIPPIVNLEGTL